ncbi:MAG: ATP-binding protein [Campylobacterales bacterium]|nr:ATP-binding protein [Campylobacterales bacterium]
MLDFNKAIEVAQDIYWVGKYLENDSFQCHPYLILNGESCVLIDPGSMLEYDELIAKVETLTSMKNVKYIIAHHQDPDICAAIPLLEKIINRDDLQVVTHKRTAALIKHYGINSEYLYISDNSVLQLSNGKILKFLTTPYAHAPGAFVTYDSMTKTLFSSDIFGGLNESWNFYADENYFEAVKLFHENYMPSREILNYSLNKIQALDIELILPQHGSIIQKKYISDLIDKLKKLDCGMYISSQYKIELLKLQDSLELEKNRYKENLEHLKTIINMQDNMIIVNANGKIVESNQAFLNFFRKNSLEQFLDEERCLCDKFISVDDNRYISSTHCINEWQEYVMKNPEIEHRVIMKNFSNDMITFKVQVRKLLTKEMQKHYVTTFIDITKDVRELDILQILSEIDDFHYIIYDKLQQKYKASKSFSAMLDIPMNGDMKNIEIRDYFQKTDCLKILKSVHKDSDKFEITLKNKHKNISFMIQSYKSYIENSLKHVFILIDISAIRQIELESKQRDTLMFQQSKMAQMGEMISMIAHQWRQPINAISASSIKLSLSNTLDKLTSDGIEEHAVFVQKQCQKMSNVIDSFMSYSSNRSEEKNFHLRDVIKTINDFVSVQYSAHNINIVIENDSSLDDVVYGREDMLEQVLLNLFSNSKDAFEKSDLEIEKCICVKYTTPKEIVVEDNAGGVDDSIIDKLFTPYLTTKDKGKGTGLGLYMGRRIMNEHFDGNLTYKKVDNKSYFIIQVGKMNE